MMSRICACAGVGMHRARTRTRVVEAASYCPPAQPPAHIRRRAARETRSPRTAPLNGSPVDFGAHARHRPRGQNTRISPHPLAQLSIARCPRARPASCSAPWPYGAGDSTSSMTTTVAGGLDPDRHGTSRWHARRAARGSIRRPPPSPWPARPIDRSTGDLGFAAARRGPARPGSTISRMKTHIGKRDLDDRTSARMPPDERLRRGRVAVRTAPSCA